MSRAGDTLSEVHGRFDGLDDAEYLRRHSPTLLTPKPNRACMSGYGSRMWFFSEQLYGRLDMVGANMIAFQACPHCCVASVQYDVVG